MLRWLNRQTIRAEKGIGNSPDAAIARHPTITALENHDEAPEAQVLYVTLEISPKEIRAYPRAEEHDLTERLQRLPSGSYVAPHLEGQEAPHRERLTAECAPLARYCDNHQRQEKKQETLLTTYDGPRNEAGSHVPAEMLYFQRDTLPAQIKTHKRISNASFFRTTLLGIAGMAIGQRISLSHSKMTTSVRRFTCSAH